MATTNFTSYEDYRARLLADKAMMQKKKAIEKLTTPPAPIPDGTPKDTRLYKVKYIEANGQIELLKKEITQLQDEYEKLMISEKKTIEKYKELKNAHEKLKTQSVDSQAVLAKVKSLIKDLRLPMSINNYRTAEGALNAFFGLIYTRIRVTEEEDVLSE